MPPIQLFEHKRIRSVWNETEYQWYFSVADVVEILTESADVRQYVKKLRQRDPQLNLNWGTICTPLEMLAADGKQRKVQCANVQGLLRIIQSIPSHNAEPFKLWLAQVGRERLEKIENPELSQTRMRELYHAKGYSDTWIEKRVRGIAVRDELTGEWKKRGVEEGLEYAILTAEISKATFGMTPSEYKEFKDLMRTWENLSDHMTDLEMIFTMLGKASTTEIARMRDGRRFDENQHAAIDGGTIAGNARKDIESKSGRRVSTKENLTSLPEKKKRRLN